MEQTLFNIVEFQEQTSVFVAKDLLNVRLKVSETTTRREDAVQTVTQRLNRLLTRLQDYPDWYVETSSRRSYAERDHKYRIKAWTDSANIKIYGHDFDALNRFVAESAHDAILDGLFYSISPQKHAEAVAEAGEKVLLAVHTRACAISQIMGFGGHYRIVKLTLDDSFHSSAPIQYESSKRFSRALSHDDSVESMQSSAGEQEIRQSVYAVIQLLTKSE